MASPEFHPTPHLIEKLKARDVTWGTILDCLEHPEVVYGPDQRGRSNYQKDDLCVVASREGAVITVLLRNEDPWTDEDARNRSRDGN